MIWITLYLPIKHCSYHLIKRFSKGLSHLLVVSERFIWQIYVCKRQTPKINLETFWVALFTYCFNSSQRLWSLNILIAFHRFNVAFYGSFASDIKLYYSKEEAITKKKLRSHNLNLDSVYTQSYRRGYFFAQLFWLKSSQSKVSSLCNISTDK